MRSLFPCLLACCLTACTSLLGPRWPPPPRLDFGNGIYLPTASAPTFGKFSFQSHSVERDGRILALHRFALKVGRRGQRVRVSGHALLSPQPWRHDRQTWVDLVPDPPFEDLAFPRRLYLVETPDGYLALTPQLGARPLWRASQPMDLE